MVDWEDHAGHYEGNLLEQLLEFLSIPSFKHAAAPQLPDMPFGKGIHDALTFYLAVAETLGFQTTCVDGYYGYIEYGEGELLGIFVHVDVVPAGEGWSHPAFSPEIRDNKLYARGALDNKGPAMTVLFALKMLKDSGLPISRRIRIVVSTDEESGWECMNHYKAREEVPLVGFTPDLLFPLVHAEKGQLNVIFSLRALHTGKHEEYWLLDFEGGSKINVVPDLASATIRHESTLRRNELQRDFQAFCQQNQLQGDVHSESNKLVLKLQGVSAHASEPEKGRNAALFLLVFLRGYSFQHDAEAFITFMNQYFRDDYSGVRLGIACADAISGQSTVNVGVVRFTSSTMPEIKINIRLPVSANIQEIFNTIAARTEDPLWRIDRHKITASHFVDSNHAIVTSLKAIYEARHGQVAQAAFSGGATLARVMKYGVAFGPVFPGRELMAHKADEYIELSDLHEWLVLYSQAIYALSKEL
ncbi:dipeptidase PepV [Paenibacillus athensensis]|uniref:Dipeptidase PepV n=1 Tax=Paenibacillus athensensis TaxID=1967502 RepID=A0A4Y8PT84_9BACL|nr:dipeptidase PepV [Paenibacillus athensensis]MCD1260555.1 dipeptidase PepV [Paenibacillus athensensis]